LGGFGCVPPVDASLSLSFTFPSSFSSPLTTTSQAQENGSVVSNYIENIPDEAAEGKPSYSLANSNDLIFMCVNCYFLRISLFFLFLPYLTDLIIHLHHFVASMKHCLYVKQKKIFPRHKNLYFVYKIFFWLPKKKKSAKR